MSRIMDDINRINNDTRNVSNTSVCATRTTRPEYYKTVKVPTKHYGLRFIGNIILCLILSTIFTFTCNVPVWSTLLEIAMMINSVMTVKNLYCAIKKSIIKHA